MMTIRDLTLAEIAPLAARKDVRKIAVENFLMTCGGQTPMDAAGNLAMDAKSYKWNAATVKAIRDGLMIAKRPAK